MTPVFDKASFKKRVREWASKLDVDVSGITIRPMRNKWASCSTNGNLTFNSDLLEFEADIRDYVIVHELLHFFVPNHGRLWKSLMLAHIGDYQAADLRLRQHHAAH